MLAAVPWLPVKLALDPAIIGVERSAPGFLVRERPTPQLR